MFARRCNTLPVISTYVALVFVLCAGRSAWAQQPFNPWNAVAADEAQPLTGDDSWQPFSIELSPHALSADGRFVVFDTRKPLVADDTNDEWDVYLRDRQTRELTRISVALDGGDANGVSSWAVISADGRDVAFLSCADNLVAGDDNQLCDVFVRDRELGTTTRVNISADGEQSIIWASSMVAINSNGRYVVFASGFPSSPELQLWLRDRDPDGNGVFDEPGFTTMAQVTPPSSTDSVQLSGYGWIVLSGDARYIAFTAFASAADGQNLGERLYVHDRKTGATSQIGMGSADPATVIHSIEPDFSDTGLLVYASDEPNLADDDSDIDYDVFVFNLVTGGHTRVQLTHEGAPALSSARAPAISSDGRYVAFMGIDGPLDGIQWWNVYGVDRESGTSYDVSVTPDGRRVGIVGDFPSISDDGSAIAFASPPYILIDSCCNTGVFVATSLRLSPDTVDVTPDGETVSISVDAPPNVGWQVQTEDLSVQLGLLELTPTEGVGAGTLDVSLPPNHTGDDREYRVIVGSEYVTVRQRSGPLVWWFDPAEGPTTGGTDVTMFGEGFAEGATVTFGGEAATNVVVENSAVIHATTPAGTAGTADLVVTNPNGTSTLYEGGFWYFDATPPVLSAAVSGTVGLNGWYTSDVTVQWSISDVESPVQQQDCPAVTLYQDAPEMIARCTATSDGGTASDHVTIKRDATPPMIQLTSPENRVYAQHAAHLVTFVCSDEMSGVASCAGPTTSGSALDTSVTGTFTFTVTADDYAGLRTTRSVTYTVKAEPTIDVPAASAPYGGSALLRATLRRNGVPIGGGVVTFLANGEVAASSITNASGEASFLMSLAGRNAGTVNIEARYAGDEQTFAGSGSGVVTINPIPLSIRANDAAKLYGEPLPAFSATATGFVNGDTFASVSGTLTFATAATSTSGVGAYAVTPAGVSSPNYIITFESGRLTVGKASTMVSATTTPNPSRPMQAVELRAIVSVLAPGDGAPSGLVEFRENGVLLGTAAVSQGVATLSYRFKHGTHAIAAVYAGDASFIGSTASVMHEAN